VRINRTKLNNIIMLFEYSLFPLSLLRANGAKLLPRDFCNTAIMHKIRTITIFYCSVIYLINIRPLCSIRHVAIARASHNIHKIIYLPQRYEYTTHTYRYCKIMYIVYNTPSGTASPAGLSHCRFHWLYIGTCMCVRYILYTLPTA